jgi:subtilisin family serine protease
LRLRATAGRSSGACWKRRERLSVSAAAKDYDLNHDDTASGDTCAGWSRAGSTVPGDDTCAGELGNQPSSVSSFSSRGPSRDLWLRPDLAAPGYDIVSAESSTGTELHANDVAPNTAGDPLYATASGTSMAAPATSGSAAVLLQAYRQKYGADPSGGSAVSGLRAPTYVLLRAALMNTATTDLYESRWVATVLGVSADLYEVRNVGPADPYVGPAAEGAGKLNVGRAVSAPRDGAVIYSAASGSAAHDVFAKDDTMWPSVLGQPGSGANADWLVYPVQLGSVLSQARFAVYDADRGDET